MKKKRKLKFLSVIFVIVFVVSSITLPANAVTSGGNSPQEPKASLAAADLFVDLKAQVDAAPTGTTTEITLAGGTYYVTETLSIQDKTIVFKTNPGETVKFVRMTTGTTTSIQNAPMIRILSEGHLILDPSANEDLVFDGERKPLAMTNNGSFISTQGQLTINGGIFENAFQSSRGSELAPIRGDGIDAKIILNDGIIRNNEYPGTSVSFSSGGIYITNSASLIMNGGEISGNKAHLFSHVGHPMFQGVWAGPSISAGAVLVNLNSTMEFNGGVIRDNASSTGGILVGANDINNYDRRTTDPKLLKDLGLSKLTMNGGLIDHNLGAAFSGGVLIFGAGEAFMPEESQTVISNNTGYAGGGIFAMDWYVDGVGKNQTRAKVSIADWSSKYPARFIMEGGSVINNTAYGCGGGVNISTDNAELHGGLIQGNIAGDQGGGVYVTAVPYTLRVFNALIEENTADSSQWVHNTSVDELDSNGNWVTYRLMEGAGGGIWFCPTGDALIFAEEGTAIFNNTATDAGDAFHNEDKVTTNYTVTLPDRMLGGGTSIWYEDYENNRYDPSNPTIVNQIKNVIVTMSLKNELAVSSQEAARSYAKLFVTGNTANKGGGFGSNGTIIFGKGPADGVPYKQINIAKIWEELTPPSDMEIPVELYANTPNGEKVIDRTVLNAENNWKASFTNLPDTLGGEPLETVVFLREAEGNYISEVSPFQVGDTVVTEETMGDETVTVTTINYQVTITNKPIPSPAEPEKPEQPTEPKEPIDSKTQEPGKVSPATGDSPMAIPVALLLVSLIVAGISLVTKRRII